LILRLLCKPVFLLLKPAGLQTELRLAEKPMSRLPSNRSGQSFVEYALLIILFAIVLLSILLILGDDLRTFINDLLQTWFPTQSLRPWSSIRLV
jgi:Flp pilus assembly pilin Flp